MFPQATNKIQQIQQLAQIASAMKSGKNVTSALEQMANSNPTLKQAIAMTKGKSNIECENTFNNMCKNFGVQPQEAKQIIKQNFGIDI